MRVSSPVPHNKARIAIIPLIDIMFFLLASFMMVSLSQVHMKGIKVNLPTGSSGETQSKREYISVSVDKDGHYFFDKNEMTEADLQAHLLQAHQSAPEPKVFVRGDRDTVHGNIVHLLDMLRSAGFYKISFEIKSEALRGVPGAGTGSDYGGGNTKNSRFFTTAGMVFLGRFWRRVSHSPHRGCACSKTRGPG